MRGARGREAPVPREARRDDGRRCTTRCARPRRASRTRSCRSATTAASTRAGSRRSGSSRAGAIGRPLVVLLGGRDTRVRPRPRIPGRPAGSWSTWRRTTTTRRAGSSARSRSRCTRRGSRSVYPGARGARRPRQRRGHRSLRRRRHRRRCTSRARALGPRRAGARSSATRARCSSASRSAPAAPSIDRRGRDGFPQDYRELFADAYVAELAAFVARVPRRRSGGPELDDDRRAVAVGVAARASAVAGRPLAVGPDWPWRP